MFLYHFADCGFESFVNSEEYQTARFKETIRHEFESFVNSEEYQTKWMPQAIVVWFESFVNSEEYQTVLL